ncbi:hypothetical protein NH8B_0511 [Pseudogulbenkiania sp. NH8B]|uniref:helix-turn-helix domain-containing protein n=1 Tax=Pseudogulbenkiania sp. (strain NH8B) TaxID=748280 RepID=UPI0002279472|nr:helix-turn-helix domain-containing protein [Pseudogulbenkiania sp. NH8B]BAK75346.1 hypothetical protein NH8B_0511 [Pseudogulbenkiania sp. NH8B]
MKKKNARPTKAETSANTQPHHRTATPPAVSGQCAEVLAILRERPAYNVELKMEYGITESAARVFELIGQGFNIVTMIEPEITYKGRVRRRVARYTLRTPAWPRPGFLSDEGDAA